MADLKLTVDISALLQAQSIVKKMDGQVINLKFNTTGLESVNMMAKGLTTSSAKTKMLVSDIGQLGSAIKKVTTKDEFGNKAKEVTTYQQAIGQTRQEIEKFNEEGKATVTTIDSISDATSKYAANAKKQDATINKINKLSAQKYAGVIDQAGLSKQKSIVSALDPKSLDFDQRYSAATKAVTKYEVAASNALFTQKEMSKLYKGTGDQAVSMFKEQQKSVDALTKGSGDQAVALFKEKQATIAALQKGTGDQAVDYFKAQEKAAKIELTNLGKKEAKIAEITTAEKKYGKVIDKNALAGIKGSFEGLDPKDINYEKKHTQLAQSLSKVTSSAKDAAYEQNQLTQANKKNLLSVENIKESMGTAAVRTVEWAATMGVLYGAVNAVRSMVTTSTAINDQMSRIQMVTGASSGETKALLTNYQNIATELSSTTSQVAASAEVWLRQGRSIADTNSLIETSTVLSKVGFMDSATSAQMLTSAINGYGIAAEDAMSVVDKMSAIDVAAATSTEDLAVAMAQTASGAKIAGVSMDELLSYIATIADVTQASGDTIGVSLKTMFARINSVKLGSLTDSEGQDISRVETALKQYGITLRDTNGTARDTGDILDDLSVKWGSLTGLQKSEIAMQMAGVHQKEKFLVLMENYNKALGYQEIAANSAGSAMQKMSIWEGTTEAATQRLTGQWEILSTKMVNSNFTKGIINLGTLGLAGLSSDLGQLVIKATALSTVLGALSMAKGKVSKGWGAIDALEGTGVLANLKSISLASKEYSATKKIVAETGVAFSEAALAQQTFKEGTIAAGVASNGLKGGLKAAGAGLLAFAGTPVGIVVAGVAALTVGFLALDAFTKDYNETLDDLNKTNEEYTTNVEKINSLKSESASLEDQIYKKQQSGSTIENDSSLSILVSKNEQLEAQISSLETINMLNKEQVSNDAHSLINWTSEQSDLQYNESSDALAPSNPVMISKPEKVKEYAQMISNVEGQINDITDAYNKGDKSAEDYNAQFGELSKKQKDYAKTANEMANAVNEQAKSLDLSSDAGKRDYETVVAMNKALKEANGLSGLTSKPDTIVGGVQAGSSAAADAVVDLEGYSNAVKGISTGLQKGVTDSDQFYEALSKIYGDNPPTNLTENLETLTALFGDGEDAATQMLGVLQNGYLEAGKLDTAKLQADLHLSQGAIDTLTGRVAEMGLLLPNAINSSTIANINAMGNGLGLAAEESVGLEAEIANLYNSVKNGADLGTAKSTLVEYLSGLNLSEDQVNGILANWDYLFDGLKESTITAFSGLQGNTAIQDAANSVSQTFSETLSKDMAGNNNEVTQISFNAAVDTGALENSVRDQMIAAGGFTETQIEQYQAEYSNRQIQLNLNAIVATEVDKIVPAGDANDKITAGIQAAYDSTTHSFTVTNAQTNISGIKVEGVEDVDAKITSAIQGINTKADTALDLTVTANTDAANSATTELIKPEEKKVTVTADTFSAISQLAGVKTNIDALHDKTVTITTNVVTNEVVNKTVISSTGTGAGIGTKSATGRINIDTSQIGTQSLVGEEGEETLIRNGNVSFIGTAGAEIIPIRDGDTILPADITKRIKSGQIPMYADGKYSVGSTTKGDTSSNLASYRRQGAFSGLAGDAPEDEDAKKAYDDHKKAFDKEADYIKHLRDMDEIDEIEYFRRLDSLNESYFANRNEYLDEYRDHEAEVYQFLKKKEEDRLKDLKDSYDSTVKSVENVIDRQIDMIKNTDNLAEAQAKYDNIKSDKIVRVYQAGLGFSGYEADAEELAEAEKDLQIAKLEEYKAEWQAITDNYEAEQDNLAAKQVLGADYEKKILEGRLDILTSFANKYSNVLADLSKIDGDKSIPVINYDKAYTSLTAYAKGTSSAKGGLSLVGEEGAELRVLNQGDGILTSVMTRNLSALGKIAPRLIEQGTSSNVTFSIANVNLENVTDFDSFIREAKQYAMIHKPIK